MFPQTNVYGRKQTKNSFISGLVSDSLISRLRGVCSLPTDAFQPARAAVCNWDTATLDLLVVCVDVCEIYCKFLNNLNKR